MGKIISKRSIDDSADLVIRPNSRFQESILTSDADIVVGGGAAGGGKTFALLMDSLQWIGDPYFRGAIFRLTDKDIMKSGSLWDQAMGLYPLVGGKPNTNRNMCWEFPSGARIEFGHLAIDKDVFDWQGTQIPWIGIDEGQLICPNNSSFRITYMLTRNRSVNSRIKPSMKIMCNPDADCWLASFLSWWIDQDTGYAIQSRSGKIRFWYKSGTENLWADSKEELYQYVDEKAKKHVDINRLIKSVTFIPSTIYDNVDLLEHNPEYLGNLLAQDLVERERLLEGNWLVRPNQGNLFDASWFSQVPASSVDINSLTKIRSWDLAATEAKKLKDPDWTVGLLLGKDARPAEQGGGTYYILDIVRLRGSPRTVEKAILDTADMDGKGVPIIMEEEPGSSGKFVTNYFCRLLDGYHFIKNKVTGAKDERAKFIASQAQCGNVKLIQAPWNRDFLSEIGYIGSGYGHDDQGDALSQASAYLADIRKRGGLSAYSIRANTEIAESNVLPPGVEGRKERRLIDLI